MVHMTYEATPSSILIGLHIRLHITEEQHYMTLHLPVSVSASCCSLLEIPGFVQSKSQVRAS